ncbi:MAG TPA: enolase C-terminal domain-like protein [Polyangia bacterium]|nr:enolase C-terminal domain-like protein [Polyangia bacterium]
MRARAPIGELAVSAFRVPTDAPESDGTLAWDHTTLVRVEVTAGGVRGWGWTYADGATARLVDETLRPHVIGRDALDVGASWTAMAVAVRNLGRRGVAAMAMSAVDCALWDLKARLLDVALVDLFGACREAVPIYGSGGFCSYDDARLAAQLGGWAERGLAAVKMKVGREPARDPERVRRARAAIGDAQLFVDANGAYDRKQALRLGRRFIDDADVRWFEEPVSSDDLDGLARLATELPLHVAAGEYGYDAGYFRRMLAAGAVDVLQADATRCGGYTGFLQASALCEAFGVPLSAHCAPALHVAVGCAARPLVHLEYFHDHVRIEELLMDGVVRPRDGSGTLRPDRSRPGHGLTWKAADAERYRL